MSETPYAWCERVSASPTSPIHLRIVGPEGMKPGGGIPGDVKALCGNEIARGWDIHNDVNEEIVENVALIPQDQPGRVCLRCVDQYLEAQL